jgi:hypothetical protein
MTSQRAKLIVGFLVLGFFSVPQSFIIHQCDTLNILNKYGREVSVTNALQFQVDSSAYPCSLSNRRIFFANLGTVYLCECCPTWSVNSPHPFYTFSSVINLSTPIILLNNPNIHKVDSSNSYGACGRLPTMNNRGFCIFIHINPSKDTNYVLVRIGNDYLNSSKPHDIASEDTHGYPGSFACNNMLIVDMYLQTDGSLDFSTAHITSVNKPSSLVKLKQVPEILSSDKIFDVQGNAVKAFNGKTPLKLRNGCYFKKSGSRWERFLFVTQ